MSRCPACNAGIRCTVHNNRRAVTTDHTNSKTTEAPPAREPGFVWHWVRLAGMGSRWRAIEVWHERVGEPRVHDSSTDNDLDISEWGPRIDPPDAKSPEPPPLPGGWTKKRDALNISWEYRRNGVLVELFDDGEAGVIDPKERLKATELHAVLAHHLGITPPAADVRALTRADMNAAVRAARGGLSDERIFELVSAYEIVRDALTDKGAPR